MQDSIMAFCSREENQDLVDQAQAEEIKEKISVEEESTLKRLIFLAEEAGPETICAVRPFIHHRIFVNLMLSMANDKQDGENEALALSRWMSNGKATDLLRAAKRAMDKNNMGEGQVESLFLAHLRDQGTITPATLRSTLPSTSLAAALNETVAERGKADKLISEGRLNSAVKKLSRCLGVVSSVRGSNGADEHEIVTARVEILIELGCLKAKLHEYGSAVALFDQALGDDPMNGRARIEKARALAFRHEHKEALEELDKGLAAAPFLEEDADDIRDMIRDMKIADVRKSKELARRMFS